MGSSQPRRSRPTGFTLIEILVSISIISILAGIVLPTVVAARERGRQAVCTSNLRQFGLAFSLYMSDYDLRPNQVQSMVAAGYIRTPALLICPDDTSGNWGGMYYNEYRQPYMAPDPALYSFITPLYWSDSAWQELLNTGSGAGIAACQLHGNSTHSGHALLLYEDLLLRLQIDGAVVRRHVIWHRANDITVADPWRLFSDEPAPKGD